MDFWSKMKIIFPVRRVWLAISARVKSPKSGAGLLKLHDDVQTCGYQDVQVMWEMLQRSESELIGHENDHDHDHDQDHDHDHDHPQRKQRPFWGVFVWSNHSTANPSFSANQA